MDDEKNRPFVSPKRFTLPLGSIHYDNTQGKQVHYDKSVVSIINNLELQYT